MRGKIFRVAEWGYFGAMKKKNDAFASCRLVFGLLFWGWYRLEVLLGGVSCGFPFFERLGLGDWARGVGWGS